MSTRAVFPVALVLLGIACGCSGPLASSSPAAAIPPGRVPPRFDPYGKFERSLIFAPTRHPVGNWQPAGLTFEDAWFASADGTRLHGWYVPHEHGPLLQSHGDADRLVPYALGQRLFATANQPKRFFTIPRGDHNDPQPPQYYDALAAFLAEVP
jgi:fermentation-respiration switch protein FrsA (DUF1100 family)